MINSTLTLPNGSTVMLVPTNPATAEQGQSGSLRKKIQLRSKSLLALSIINIILWFVSTSLQVATLVAFSGRLFGFYSGYNWDIGGWGIWCSLFYAISGFTGYSASYNKKRSLIITSLVFAAFSIATSIVAGTFSGIQAGYTLYSWACRVYDYNTGQYIYNYYECSVWGGLEWTMMSIHIIAFAINIAVVAVTAMAVCGCCNRKKGTVHQGFVAPIPNATAQYPMVAIPTNAATFGNPVPQQQNYGVMNQPFSQVLQQLSQQQHEGLLQQSSDVKNQAADPATATTPTAPLHVETEKK